MNKDRKTLGFTMAEMLIVVAIIMVLSGVAFIAVASHQRSMAQLERDTIAKEIFVAAQNHLTMAESQGYLPDEDGNADYGKQIGSVTSITGRTYDNVYTYSVSDANDFTGNGILDLMLPFGSIDETVRAGGSYIIRYQARPAIVLDVFYCPKAASSSGQLRFTHDLGNDDYSDVEEYAGDKDRKNCLSDHCVLGWYGGAVGGDSGLFIETPTIEVINKERLTVNIFDPNNSATDNTSVVSLCLLITGEKQGTDDTSRPQAAIQLKNGANNRFKWVPASNGVKEHYEVILDDITTGIGTDDDGLHFADLNKTKNSAITLKKDSSGNPILFKSGENITVQVVAYSNNSLTNIAYSVERTTNSLFADYQPVAEGSTDIKAMIANFRHLENLDKAVSGLQETRTTPDGKLSFTAAEQIADFAKPVEPADDDLSWSGFVDAIKAGKGNATSAPVKVYALNDSTGTTDNCYRPVDLTYALDYNGNHHKIEGVKVDYNADAGLFGTIGIAGSSIENLELIDFSITTSSGDAGALAGKLVQDSALDAEDFNVSNVVAYHTDGKAQTEKINTESGNAGGLIGQTTGEYAKIEKSAAALIVSSTGGNAGGLIGTAAGGTVSGCYSGGHTIDKKNGTGTNADVIGVTYDSDKFNVTASGVSGGLIGDAGKAKIEYSYSTCSAIGATVGGLIGKGSWQIQHSYCTGLVKGTGDSPVEGAFAGNWTYTGQTEDDDNHYYEIINERENPTDGYTYLYPVPGSESFTGIRAIDETATTYNDFCGTAAGWKPAIPYKEQTKLETYYGGKYNLKTVEQLGADIQTEEKTDDDGVTTPADFVATHHGDWPAPEIFVVNTKNTGA